MAPPYTGRCFCEAVLYRIMQAPLTLYACHCTDCQKRSGIQYNTRLWSEPEKYPRLAVVRPGTLDDTSWLRPVAHLWTRSAQPWFEFPEGVVRFATQPDDLKELVQAANRRGISISDCSSVSTWIYPLLDICRHMAPSTNRWFHLHMDSLKPVPLRPNH